jgi:hypothetical protein
VDTGEHADGSTNGRSITTAAAAVVGVEVVAETAVVAAGEVVVDAAGVVVTAAAVPVGSLDATRGAVVPAASGSDGSEHAAPARTIAAATTGMPSLTGSSSALD